MDSTKSFWETFPGYTEHNFRTHCAMMLVHKDHPAIKVLKWNADKLFDGGVFPEMPLIDNEYLKVTQEAFTTSCNTIERMSKQAEQEQKLFGSI